MEQSTRGACKRRSRRSLAGARIQLRWLRRINVLPVTEINIIFLGHRPGSRELWAPFESSKTLHLNRGSVFDQLAGPAVALTDLNRHLRKVGDLVLLNTRLCRRCLRYRHQLSDTVSCCIPECGQWMCGMTEDFIGLVTCR